MRVHDFTPVSGRHGESCALKGLLDHAGTRHPNTGQPLSEALCFGIAGGIGAGYNSCPSMIRHGIGCGINVVGRHLAYATDAAWYQGFADRIGATTRVTETAAPGKALQNLKAELEGGRPVVVWCSRTRLPFLADYRCPTDLFMHTLVIYGLDEATGHALGSDRAAGGVTIFLNALAEARGGVCSHKNRTLVMEVPASLPEATWHGAIQAGIRATAAGLLTPKIKRFGLAGLDVWANMVNNGKSKDGWPKMLGERWLYDALRDVYDAIETGGTGGGLFRLLYADFLEEAALILKQPALAELAGEYRRLAQAWTNLAEAALPAGIKPFKQTRDLLAKHRKLYQEKGEKAGASLTDIVVELRQLQTDLREAFPLSSERRDELLEDVRERVVALHAAETAAARQLHAAVGPA